ncbi:hypothetical protein AJ78_08880 [Emergomyces pasteurianus Ep9510]|uniref:Uncharacterized protein n=1 Tax=Emergomyces pasteurianus Ep9510 TaxID=1447872 RepID=A0A1J9Q3Y9_9EURO|nr:hypothetical protein AJ78_08880 [Emergomyces pasteurianus Ep9510]
MSTSSRTDVARTSDSSPAATEQRAAISQITTTQSGYQEISRWSPNTSSLAPSTAGGSSAQALAGTSGPAGATVNSTTAVRGSNTIGNNTTTDSVEAERERARLALEYGGTSAPASERTAEQYTSAVTQDPQAAQQLSSSGRYAQGRRG